MALMTCYMLNAVYQMLFKEPYVTFIIVVYGFYYNIITFYE